MIKLHSNFPRFRFTRPPINKVLWSGGFQCYSHWVTMVSCTTRVNSTLSVLIYTSRIYSLIKLPNAAMKILGNVRSIIARLPSSCLHAKNVESYGYRSQRQQRMLAHSGISDGRPAMSFVLQFIWHCTVQNLVAVNNRAAGHDCRKGTDLGELVLFNYFIVISN